MADSRKRRKVQPSVCPSLSAVSSVVEAYLHFLVDKVKAFSVDGDFCTSEINCLGLIQQRLLASFGQCTEDMHPFRIILMGE